ncbi:MAG: TlpA disulfide reductase family protein [Pseudomonadota bacterium]
MRLFRSLVLYAGLCLMGNPAAADMGRLMGLAVGELGRIQFHAEPRDLALSGFLDANGQPTSLEAYRGTPILLNFWALWCAPCVKEMPALNALNGAVEGDFEVVTVAVGRNARPAVDAFFAEKQLDNLPKLFDAKMTLPREARAPGLPVSIFIDAQGREVARAVGDFHWDSPASVALVNAWVSGG